MTRGLFPVRTWERSSSPSCRSCPRMAYLWRASRCWPTRPHGDHRVRLPPQVPARAHPGRRGNGQDLWLAIPLGRRNRQPGAADAIEVGIARFAEHGVGVETCLFGLDGSDDIEAIAAAALRARPWECVVIGGGVRNEDQLELFEQVLNLVRRYAPDAAIAFNSTPADTFDAAARWMDIPGPASAS